MVKAAVDKIPQLDPRDVADLILGCGQPGGEQGNNLARVVATYSRRTFSAVSIACSRSLASSKSAVRQPWPVT
jgi:acetyl-CoA C-acetyltransferase